MMAKREPNPNTKYGRKRLRQEHQQWRENLTPEERESADSFSMGATVVIIGIILIIIFLIGGSDGVLKWLSR